jgi:hypothetical protein
MANAAAVAPVSCKPSMTIYNYSGAATQYTLFSVNLSATATAPTAASNSIITCTPAATAGSTCSAAAANPVAAGTAMTISAGGLTSGAAPGGGGFLVAFSCM